MVNVFLMKMGLGVSVWYAILILALAKKYGVVSWKQVLEVVDRRERNDLGLMHTAKGMGCPCANTPTGGRIPESGCQSV